MDSNKNESLSFYKEKGILTPIASELAIAMESTIDQILNSLMQYETPFYIIAKSQLISYNDDEVGSLLKDKHTELIRFDLENFAFDTLVINRFDYNYSVLIFRAYFSISTPEKELEREVELTIPLLAILQISSLKTNEEFFYNSLIKQIENITLKKTEKKINKELEQMRRYNIFVATNPEVFDI
jgi:hypothetical protein